MPRRPPISFVVAFLLASLVAAAPFAVARLGAEEGAAKPSAEMLLDLELLADRDFAAHPRDLRSPPAEDAELLDNLEALDSDAERREGAGGPRKRNEDVR